MTGFFYNEIVSDFTILVKQEGDIATARIIGRGSFKNAKLLKNYAEQARKDGARQFVFDMRECLHMDSTFMGIIAGIAVAQKNAGAPVPRVINANPRALDLLNSLGLGQILDIDPANNPGQSVSFTELSANDGDENKAEVAQTMLEAHEILMNIDKANVSKFQDVITFLKNKVEDQEKK